MANITLTATVLSPNPLVVPTGVIVFNNGSITLGVAALNSSGIATLTIDASVLGSGPQNLLAYYAGDANFAAGVSIPIINGTPGPIVGTPPAPPTISSVSFVSGQAITNSSTAIRLGGREINMSFFPSTFSYLNRAVNFKAIIETTSSSAVCQVVLMDVTNNVAIANTTGTTSTSSGLVLFDSGPLTVGTAAGNIRTDAITMYEVHLNMPSGVVGSDFAICTNARIEIVYS